jgi:hypothetical protein
MGRAFAPVHPAWRQLRFEPCREFVTALIGSNDLLAHGSRHRLPQLFAKPDPALS